MATIETFVEESLLLPTQNVRLFAATFLLIFAHTFLFLAVAVLHAHPLAASVLVGIQSFNTVNNYPIFNDRTAGHAKKLFAIYLAYLASKLTCQVVAALAVSATYSGERRAFIELLRWRLLEGSIRGPLVTAALVGALELASTTLLLELLGYYYCSNTASSSGMGIFYGCWLLVLAGFLYIYLGAAFVLSVAVSAVDEGCSSLHALCRAWKLMRSRREEAAVLVVVANLFPVVIYPVYMSALYTQALWFSGGLFGFILPCVGVQLLSMVAATVFYCQSMETNEMVQF